MHKTHTAAVVRSSMEVSVLQIQIAELRRSLQTKKDAQLALQTFLGTEHVPVDADDDVELLEGQLAALLAVLDEASQQHGEQRPGRPSVAGDAPSTSAPAPAPQIPARVPHPSDPVAAAYDMGKGKAPVRRSPQHAAAPAQHSTAQHSTAQHAAPPQPSTAAAPAAEAASTSDSPHQAPQ